MLNADTPDPRSRHILAATPPHPNINHVELSIRAPKRQTNYLRGRADNSFVRFRFSGVVRRRSDQWGPILVVSVPHLIPSLDYLLSSRSTMAERTFYIMICMSCVTSSTPVFSMRRQSILMPCCFSSVPFIRAKSRSSVGVCISVSSGGSGTKCT